MAVPLGVTAFPTYGSFLRADRCCRTDEHSYVKKYELVERKLAPTPAHLSRAIYVPYHGGNTSHLPLYDISKAYERSIGDALVGGAEFKTRLCLMAKPTHNSVNTDVRFWVDVEPGTGRAVVEERRLGVGEQVNMLLPSGVDEDFYMDTSLDGRQHSVTTSYPLPDRRVRGQTIRYPYFTVTSPDEKHTLEWQVRPDTLGKLGYVLVDSTTPSVDEPEILAMYHHAGIEPELPHRYAEGVLLLPEHSDRINDTVIVASLFGLLWKIRAMGRKTGCKRRRMWRLGDIFQRRPRGMTRLP